MAVTLVEKYIERLNMATSLTELNNIVDEAADDENLTNGEYEDVYLEGLRLARM